MTVIEITNPASAKERNVGEFLFRKMVANEYQIELTNKEDIALVGFWKGEWTVKVNEHPIVAVSDGGSVNPRGNPLHEGFITAKLEAYESNGYDSPRDAARDCPAYAIWHYVTLLAPKFLTESYKIIVHLPGRNGMVTDDGLEVNRKDW